MTFDRRRYAREYARRARARKLAAKMAGLTHCPFQLGRVACGGRLEFVTDRLGRVVAVCQKCERRKRGLCQECPRPVAGTVGRALRCEYHKRLASMRATRRYAAEHREEVNAKARAYAQRPDVRALRSAYKKAWRKANPDKVKAQKRREALRQNPNRTRYLRAWRKRNPDKVRAYAERRRRAA